MKSVTSKNETLRRATATGRVVTAAESIARMVANDLPKKDVLAVARVAGVMAAKRTPDLIPYCHHIAIDHVDIAFDVGDTHVDVTATVEAIAKTGVEMEALSAVAAAALTVYDMLKAVDPEIVVEQVRLQEKRGGKSDFTSRLPRNFSVAVIVTSDGTFAGKREDRSGVFIREFLAERGVNAAYEVLPDEADQIAARLTALAEAGTDLVLTTGGTGLGPRDVTVEATQEVIEREAPGIMEAARVYGQRRTPYAMLSRGIAGVRGGTIIVNLPGSTKGTEETLYAIFPGIIHAFAMLRGGGH